MKKELISIIIPVYNVYDYLSDCIKTVVAQTYTNIEIILINDGSTDKSPDLCMKWASQDDRIVYISKKNEGLGPTRNYGVSIANGKYISFVDSDDWLELDFLEKLYDKAVETNADIVECDIARHAMDSGISSVTICGMVMGREFTLSERMILGNVAQWKMLFKKDFYTKLNILQPNLPSEDLAVYAFEAALASKIAYVNEALYHYRKKRPGAISNSMGAFLHVHSAADYLIDLFKKKGIFKEYEMILMRVILRWTSRLIVPCIPYENRDFCFEIENNFRNILNKNFPAFCESSAVLWGGYNLTKIVQNTNCIENPYLRFQFSSIISLMSNPSFKWRIDHKNPYRQFMINRELSKSLFDIIKKEKPKYFIIDLIEERHDIIKVGNSYLTFSDALQGAVDIPRGVIIKRLSKECTELWKECCLKFISFLRMNFSNENIILVRNLLAESHGNIHKRSKYDDYKEIEKYNELLNMYYQFFIDNLPGVKVIDFTDDSLYVTDDDFEYGCYPWHLNALINSSIGREIAKKMN